MQWDYILKLLIATALGTAIGFERKKRVREAGMRTHSIVALGSCLMMLISIHAFPNNHDTSRVAAQIISGVGFLGAGMIMFKSQEGIHGLTTAAGIWATAGIGMAIGGGMYILGVGAAVLVIIIQFVLHLPFKLFRTKRYTQLKIEYEQTELNNQKIKEIFNVKTFTKIKATKDSEKINFTVFLTTDVNYPYTVIGKILEENDFIKSIERVDND